MYMNNHMHRALLRKRKKEVVKKQSTERNSTYIYTHIHRHTHTHTPASTVVHVLTLTFVLAVQVLLSTLNVLCRCLDKYYYAKFMLWCWSAVGLWPLPQRQEVYMNPDAPYYRNTVYIYLYYG